MEETLSFINAKTGLNLRPCTYFTGMRELNGKKYFNVILAERISESLEYAKLKRFADKYGRISVQPNGVNRIAIFLTN